MTETQIEWFAEREMDKLDRKFLSGELTQRDYDLGVKNLSAMIENMYRLNRRRA